MSSKKLVELQEFERAEKLVRELSRQETSLSKAAGPENLSIPQTAKRSESFMLNRIEDSAAKNDMSLMREQLDVFRKVLVAHDKSSPTLTTLDSLLTRINAPGGRIGFDEFLDAAKEFAKVDFNKTSLRDDINNKNLYLDLHPEELTQDIDEPSKVINLPQADQKTQEGEPDEPPTEQEESAPAPPPQQLPQRKPPNRVIVRRPEEPEKSTETSPEKPPERDYSKNTAEGRKNRTEKARDLWKKRSGLAKPASAKSGWGIFDGLATKVGKWLADKLGLTRAAKWLADKTGITNIGKWLADKTGLTYVNNALNAAKSWLGNATGYTPAMNAIRNALGNLGSWASRGLQNLLSQALNSGLSLASALAQGLVRAAVNALSRLALQAGLMAARAVLLVALFSPITWVIIGLVVLFAFVWWTGEQIANSECNKPTGEMRMVKRLGGIGSLEIDPAKIEAAVQNGQQIDFVIEASYQLACRTRTLSSVTVTDRVPEGTEYIDGSAISGFYQTNGEPIKGIYDANTRTLTWNFTNFPMSNPVFIYFSVQPNSGTTDTWVMNQATVRYTEGGRSGLKGGIINIQSPSLQAVIDQAAQRVGMEPALMKAFLRVEAQGVLSYSEEQFQFFSTPGWWEGLVDNASTREGNDPIIVQGYGYNTCAYMGCAAGADVRGVAQFEAKTWEGIAKQLDFSDGHPVDRRIATDAIFGSALLNRENAEYYTGSPNFEWTEEVIRAAGRIYCGGKSVARVKLTDGACMQGGKQYEDLLWGFYLEYSGK